VLQYTINYFHFCPSRT